jgi:hypothetical protein
MESTYDDLLALWKRHRAETPGLSGTEFCAQHAGLAEELLDCLIVRWEELPEPVALDQFCRDCPELCEPLRGELDKLAVFNRLANGECPSMAAQAGALPGPLQGLTRFYPRDLFDQGGMGTIYGAEEEALRRQVLVKMARRDMPAGSGDQFRLEAERSPGGWSTPASCPSTPSARIGTAPSSTPCGA